MKQRIVLAYDGSPDGSDAISWLAEQHGADIVTLTLDLGGGAALDGVRDLALGRGAVRAHVLEVQEEFAREVVIPAAQAGTLSAGASIEPLLQPLLAKKLVDVARIENAYAVGFVANGQEEDRLAGLIAVLDPTLTVIVKPPAVGGVEPWLPRRSAPTPLLEATAAQVDIAFKEGVPVAINGIPMRLPELLESLATIAAEHGIAGGAHAFVPAAVVLQAAYAALAPGTESAVRLKLSHGSCVVCEDVGLER